MHPMVESFLERPMAQKVGVAAFSVLLVGGLAYQYLLGPALTELSELEERKNTLQSQIVSERRVAQNLPRFQEEVKELQIKLKIALQELPDEKDIPNLLKSVADLAKDSGLEVSLFRPEPESKREFFAEVPVTMQVEGTYHQIATFFDEVGRMPRIVNVRNIALTQPKMTEKGLIVKSDCSAVTFRYLPESERVQDQEGEGKKRRR